MDHRSVTRKADHADRVLQAVSSRQAAAQSAIAASWARSFHLHNLHPDGVRETQQFDTSALTERCDRLGRLLHVAQPTIERLHAMLQLAGCSVVLCDAEGVVLKALSLEGDAQTFNSAGLRAGADWSENAQGTNGIGTCITEERSVSVLRDQHFTHKNTEMSCFGAPIFDSDGGLNAVLDVSTCREDLGPALMVMISQSVSDAAERMEADHFCDQFSAMRIIQGTGSSAHSASLLAVDSYDLVVGATRAARRLYGLPTGKPFDPVPAADLLGDASSRGTGFESAERRELQRALVRAKGNVSAAARALGVSRATFYRRAAKFDLLTKSD